MELGGASRELADFLQYLLPLALGQYAHARCCEQEERCIRDFFEGYVFERMAEELVEVFGADIVRVFAEG